MPYCKSLGLVLPLYSGTRKKNHSALVIISATTCENNTNLYFMLFSLSQMDDTDISVFFFSLTYILFKGKERYNYCSFAILGWAYQDLIPFSQLDSK